MQQRFAIALHTPKSDRSNPIITVSKLHHEYRLTLTGLLVILHLNLQETPTKTVLSLVMGGMEG
ncbi:hypothetical protein [Dolichospermum sp. LEGE 00246]|uniref:hypothetical protein n=1 Tax=Dolichospermum sp. LEGE 00246 TaxID=1828605 RepID=UPI001882C47F|nr:hypothetical protein [Dolichospermum sp. LEGE 00246]